MQENEHTATETRFKGWKKKKELLLTGVSQMKQLLFLQDKWEGAKKEKSENQMLTLLFFSNKWSF